MNWSVNIQQGPNEEICGLGSKLSVEIGCPVHYPAYNKNLFECACGVIFPLYMVKGGNWEVIRQKHYEEKELARR